MIRITQAEFIAFYPQFAGFEPAFVLSVYLSQANERFSAFTQGDAEEARRLYAAHKLTMYARAVLPENAPVTRAALAAAGQAPQRIAGKKAGEVSVTYETGAPSASYAVSAALADLPETSFGLQLLALIRRYSRSVLIR